MRNICDYCGDTKEEHDHNGTTTRNHVKYKSVPITSIKGTVHFHGRCDRKARNDNDWSL